MQISTTKLSKLKAERSSWTRGGETEKSIHWCWGMTLKFSIGTPNFKGTQSKFRGLQLYTQLSTPPLYHKKIPWPCMKGVTFTGRSLGISMEI